MVFLGEGANASQLVPIIARKIEPKAIIVPVDAYEWLPRGLERQIAEELRSSGFPAVFPRPFCSLGKTGNPHIDEFSVFFGIPKLSVKVEENKIERVEVLRDAPCGSTHYAAKKILGLSVDEAPSVAGLYVQAYPCLASHVRDPIVGEDMIHVSATIMKKAVEKALGL